METWFHKQAVLQLRIPVLCAAPGPGQWDARVAWPLGIAVTSSAIGCHQHQRRRPDRPDGTDSFKRREEDDPRASAHSKNNETATKVGSKVPANAADRTAPHFV